MPCPPRSAAPRRAFARRAFFPLLLFLLAPALRAQVYWVGPKVAYQSVWILNQNNYGLSEMGYELTAGPAYGLSLAMDWNAHWGIQVEYQRSHQGQDYRDNIGLQLILGINDVFDVGKEVDIVYGQVPILARYRGGGERVAFLGLLGAQVGIRGETTLQYTVDGNTVPFDVLPGGLYPDLLTARDFYRSIDIGLAGGAGLEWTPSDWFYTRLAARFYLGLSDSNAEATRGAPEYGASRNATVGLELGMGLRVPVSEPRTWTRKPGR